MSGINKTQGHIHYQIKIKGQLRENWADWLNGNSVRILEGPRVTGETVILIKVIDQAALRGIVNKLWDLNLQILSLNTLGSERKNK